MKHNKYQTSNEGCKCFMCRNKNNPEVLYGYFKGQIEVYEDTIRTLDKLGISTGSIHENNLSGFKACCQCNFEEAQVILEDVITEILQNKTTRFSIVNCPQYCKEHDKTCMYRNGYDETGERRVLCKDVTDCILKNFLVKYDLLDTDYWKISKE